MKKLKLHNERMLQAIDYIVRNRVRQCNDEEQCLKSIGYTSKTNFRLIKSGVRGFTEAHMQKMCEYYGVDANFLLRKDHTKMFYEDKTKDPVDMIKEALFILETKTKKLRAS